jgi:hypothetical protein
VWSILLSQDQTAPINAFVRVHYIIAAFLCLSTVLIVWWNGVKHKDFITPPSPELLAKVRKETLQSLGAPEIISNEVPTKAILVKATSLILPNPALEKETAKIKDADTEVGDLITSPGLNCYASFAEKGALHLINLATLLEGKGELQRSLLAWERVIDVVKPEKEQYNTACNAIQRLKPQLPPWNIDPSACQVLVLNAGCDRDTAKLLEPILAELADFLANASSGIVQIKSKIFFAAAPTKGASQLPIALWFSGPSDNSVQSKTISIPSQFTNPAAMKRLVLASAYKLIRDDIASKTAFQAPNDLKENEDAAPLLTTVLTRLLWQEFATRLNSPP